MCWGHVVLLKNTRHFQHMGPLPLTSHQRKDEAKEPLSILYRDPFEKNLRLRGFRFCKCKVSQCQFLYFIVIIIFFYHPCSVVILILSNRKGKKIARVQSPCCPMHTYPARGSLLLIQIQISACRRLKDLYQSDGIKPLAASSLGSKVFFSKVNVTKRRAGASVSSAMAPRRFVFAHLRLDEKDPGEIILFHLSERTSKWRGVWERGGGGAGAVSRLNPEPWHSFLTGGYIFALCLTVALSLANLSRSSAEQTQGAVAKLWP